MIQRLLATWLLCGGLLFAVLHSANPTVVARNSIVSKPVFPGATHCAMPVLAAGKREDPTGLVRTDYVADRHAQCHVKLLADSRIAGRDIQE